MLKVLKQKISDAAAWIDIDLGYGLYSRGVWRAPVQYSLVQYRQGYVHCGRQKSKIPLPRLVSTLTLRKDSQKCDCSRSPRSLMLKRLDDSILRGHVASISPKFN